MKYLKNFFLYRLSFKFFFKANSAQILLFKSKIFPFTHKRITSSSSKKRKNKPNTLNLVMVKAKLLSSNKK